MPIPVFPSILVFQQNPGVLSQTYVAVIHLSQEFRLKKKIPTKQSFKLQVPVNRLLGQEEGHTALSTEMLGQSTVSRQDRALLPWARLSKMGIH